MNSLRLLSTATLLSLSLSAATLTGRVTARDSLRPLAGATIVAFRLPLDPGFGPDIQRATTTLDGNYRFADLKSGSYRLCIVTTGYYLDPCDWADPISTTVGLTSSTKDILLDPGVPVTLALDDPQSHSRAVSLAQPLVSATVSNSSGRIRHLIVKNTGAGLRGVQLVPSGSNIQIRVSSQTVMLGDSDGNRIDEKGHTISLPAPLVNLRAPAAIARGPFNFRPQPGTVVRLSVRGLLPAR